MGMASAVRPCAALLSRAKLSPCFVLFAILLSAAAQSGVRFPRIERKALAGSTLAPPGAAAGKIALLIFGFTRASKAEPATGQKRSLRISALNRDLRCISFQSSKMWHGWSVAW